MAESALEEAYQEAGPLVHTLALRALGSVEEAEDVVRRVFASAASGGASLDPRDLLHDAAERITGDLERRVRAKLAALDDDVPVEPVTDTAAVVAEADRILLRAAMDRLDTDSRELLDRALVHGDPRDELALMTGISPEELEGRLRDALLSVWSGSLPDGDEHATAQALASRVLGIRVVDGRMPHIGACPECKAAWRSLNDLVGSITRLPATGPVLAPRAGLWDELRRAIEAGEGVEPEADWREEAKRAAARTHRRRTLIMTTAIVLASLLAGLAVVLAQVLVEPDSGTRVSSAILVDPRDGGVEVGRAVVEQRDASRVLIVEGPYAESANSYLELWVIAPDSTRWSLGTLQSTRYEVAVPDGAATGVGYIVQITREQYDGDPGPSSDIVANGVLR